MLFDNALISYEYIGSCTVASYLKFNKQEPFFL